MVTFIYFLKKRLIEAFGLCLLISGLLLTASLMSYEALDPSWNVAIDGNAQNIFGENGALFADLFHQSFGQLSYIFAAVMSFWGFNFFIHRSWQHVFLRFVALPIVIVALGINSFILSLPLQSGFVVSSFLKIIPINQLHPTSTMSTVVASGIFIGLLVSLIIISGLTWHDIRQVGINFNRIINFIKVLRSKLYWRQQASTSLKAAQPTMVQTLQKSYNIASLSMWKTIKTSLGGLVNTLRARSTPTVASHATTITEPVFFRNDDFESDSFQPNSSFPSTQQDRDCNFDIERPSMGMDSTLDIQNTVSSESFKSTDNLKPPSMRDAVKSVKNSFSQPANGSPLDLSKESTYHLPPLNLLKQPEASGVMDTDNDNQLQENARQLMAVLEEFGVKGQITKVRPGPVVTLYELIPAAGVKTSRVVGLADDIARSMCALSARIAVIPGQNALGIELPNKSRQIVLLQELITHNHFDNPSLKLALALGKDISGAPIMTDLARMPHLLVAGTTGSGKSVAVNTMILSLLYRLSPERCRFIMIDPKMLELSVYDGIPHLLAPVVTEPKKAIYALKWTVREMEDRYRAMSRLGVRNIEGYNARLHDAMQRNETLTREVQTGFDAETGQMIYETQPLNSEQLPYIVVVVDEMADLMMVAGKEIEAAVQRLAQMARAAGIHLIMATQRPSVDVITGTIKANFPTRISFQVTSRFDSRTILGEQGAEQLLGRGDMLFMEPGGKIQRAHGPFVTDEEVAEIVKFLKDQGSPNYLDTITEDAANTPLDSFDTSETSKDDQLYQQAVAIVQREGKASTSFIQRHLRIGYNNAARIIEQMESQGIISSANHVGKREVLVRA